MKALMFASSIPPIVKRVINDFASDDVVALIPANYYDGYSDMFGGKVMFVRISTPSFDGVPYDDLRNVIGVKYDCAVIVCGGLGFVGFTNVLEVAAKFSFKKIIFCNKVGRKEIIDVKRGIWRVIDGFFVTVVWCFFDCLRRVELFVERGYIRCAELLGL